VFPSLETNNSHLPKKEKEYFPISILHKLKDRE
jgi:hypothetical protein